MRTLLLVSLAIVVLVNSGLTAMDNDAWVQEERPPAHAHIEHVSDAFRGTPDGVGLLSASVAEMEIAAQHAGLAVNSDDILRIKAHIGHVVHALDPNIAESGPGKGYGGIRAAESAARHLDLATKSDGASDNIKRHAEHVNMSLQNVINWAHRTLDLARGVNASESMNAVQALAVEIEGILTAILAGRDGDDEDENISWSEGEGGLAQAISHMGFMKKGEGLSGS